MRNLKIAFAQWLVDCGLAILNFGPKDEEDRRLERELIQKWKDLEALRVARG